MIPVLYNIVKKSYNPMDELSETVPVSSEFVFMR